MPIFSYSVPLSLSADDDSCSKLPEELLTCYRDGISSTLRNVSIYRHELHSITGEPGMKDLEHLLHYTFNQYGAWANTHPRCTGFLG